MRKVQRYFTLKVQRRKSICYSKSQLFQKIDGTGDGTKRLKGFGEKDRGMGVSWVEKAWRGRKYVAYLSNRLT